MTVHGRAREWVRRTWRRVNVAIADHVFAYGRKELEHALRRLGLSAGDTVLVHSALKYDSGFRGEPQLIIEALLAVVGASGHVMMVSIPYQGSTYEYLRHVQVFDVRKTPSRMGLLTEIFRRRKDVVRSVHPTHPVLAWGPRAAWLVEGHERSVYPCGPETPFGKLRQLGGKTLFLDVPFNTFTFIHYIEDHLKDRLPLPLYGPDLASVRVLDQAGSERQVATYTFSETAVRARRPNRLRDELRGAGLLRATRVGRSSLLLVSVEDAVTVAERMVAQGRYFHAV
jgi:aminoglycoside 3-N-acetyltransferase